MGGHFDQALCVEESRKYVIGRSATGLTRRLVRYNTPSLGRRVTRPPTHPRTIVVGTAKIKSAPLRYLG